MSVKKMRGREKNAHTYRNRHLQHHDHCGIPQKHSYTRWVRVRLSRSRGRARECGGFRRRNTVIFFCLASERDVEQVKLASKKIGGSTNDRGRFCSLPQMRVKRSSSRCSTGWGAKRILCGKETLTGLSLSEGSSGQGHHNGREDQSCGEGVRNRTLLTYKTDIPFELESQVSSTRLRMKSTDEQNAWRHFEGKGGRLAECQANNSKKALFGSVYSRLIRKY